MEINFINKRLKLIIDAFKGSNSLPKTELYYINNFTLLIAIMFSAQCTDKMVNKVTISLFQEYNSPEDFRKLSIPQIEELIKKINFYKTKAKNLFMISKILSNNPLTLNVSGLMELPGVGLKTASVFLSILNKEKIIAVDTHIFRVLNRINLFYSKKVNTTYKIINNLVQSEDRNKLHHWIILHGRYICKAKKPLCDKCKINYLCFKKFD